MSAFDHLAVSREFVRRGDVAMVHRPTWHGGRSDQAAGTAEIGPMILRPAGGSDSAVLFMLGELESVAPSRLQPHRKENS